MITPTTLRSAATADFPALSLRPWREDDVPALVEAYADPFLRRWTAESPDDAADGLRWVARQRRGWEEGLRFAFAVLEAGPQGGPGRLVGGVVLKRPVPDGASAEVGYWTAAPARGRGVAPRALEALTAWAFEAFGDSGPERLELLHQEDNGASCRVAEKSGYAFRAVLPAAPPEFPLSGHLHVRAAGA
ncbi:GNAT family N-acetyltransferase [Streptomyces lavendulae]|uniref:GNAT family N-acetyltransferase n=1 Tax=Streptomyces lavendulae TaxID=1914 RepID=UPI0024A5BE02|nr:GNAT family N-acetyltransferase [Streptomyces lavendulae]GLX20942.1 acetyltransferase [Streptomyces lavendulae subsp. lavendulae]GLX25773.1 acetyltransferase [Streptomyces lavendulae subsp. lavendulae]